MSSIIKEEYDTFDGYVDALEDRVEELENRPHDEVLLHDMELMQAAIDQQVDYVAEAGTRAADYKLRINKLESALRSLADDDWWDMETPSTAADFALKALEK